MADFLFIMGLLFISFRIHTVVRFSDVHLKLFGDIHTLFSALSLW